MPWGPPQHLWVLPEAKGAAMEALSPPSQDLLRLHQGGGGAAQPHALGLQDALWGADVRVEQQLRVGAQHLLLGQRRPRGLGEPRQHPLPRRCQQEDGVSGAGDGSEGMEASGMGWVGQTWMEDALLVVPTWVLSDAHAWPCSVTSLCTETLPLLAVTFITENSLVAAVSPGWATGWVLC